MNKIGILVENSYLEDNYMVEFRKLTDDNMDECISLNSKVTQMILEPAIGIVLF